ncbi:MAG: hypothetical protein ABL884_09800 [Methyloglobulus sp.]
MFSPEEIQKKICDGIGADSSFNCEPAQLNPGKVWQGLSADLFIANLDQEIWGWADLNTIFLLNFWRDFDPQTRFVLVYSSPTYALAQLLREQEISPALIESFCSSWLRVNSELLRFYNRNLDRSVLFNIEALSLPLEANRLLSVSRDRLGVSLSAPADWCIEQPMDDAAFRLFAYSLLQEHPSVQVLYKELESVADIIYDFPEPQKEILIAKTFVQYQHLAERHGEARELSTQLNVQVLELQSQLGQIQQELAFEKQKPDQSSQLKDLKKENELLLLQMHQVQEELESYFLQCQRLSSEQVKVAKERQTQIQQLTQARDQQAKLAAERHSQIQQLVQARDGQAEERQTQIQQLTQARDEQAKLAAERQSQIQQLVRVRDEKAKLVTEQQALIQKQTRTQNEYEILSGENARLKNQSNVLEAKLRDAQASVSSKQSELTKENELLLLQLHQVQKELEHYFLKYQEVTQSKSYVTFLQDLAQPTEPILVDFCRPVDGDNWYDAEANGSWAGPEKISTIRIPSLSPGQYQLKLDVVDAKNPKILDEISLSYNGQAIFLQRQGNTHNLFFALFKKKVRYPVQLQAIFTVNATQASKPGVLAFQFAKLISSQIRGRGDNRFLAIQVCKLHIASLRTQEIVGIDLRKDIQGQNWYHVEPDGRWAGPGKFSTLSLPKVKSSRYKIEIEVVDAMAPQILKGTKFSLNGIPLNFVDPSPLSLLRRLIGKRKKYPVILTAHVDVSQSQCNAGLNLEFEFPSVISPASRGSDDNRHLALRLRTVKLIPLP